MQRSMQKGHVFLRRNHINAIRPHQSAILDLDDFHARGPLEQFRHDAFARRVQMLNDDKCHTAADRHIFQKLFQCFESAGGRTNADDRKRGFHSVVSGFQVNVFDGSFG
jgi:hypothetical protein